jgi:hypothetical protein
MMHGKTEARSQHSKMSSLSSLFQKKGNNKVLLHQLAD